jgi:8-oxo-dGTP pyrophosphatase MutT (NUDIX family)
VIEAAGGVVWRRSPEGRLEVLLVHRPHYDDWSLPKGKLDPGETAEEAAVREVHEEAGVGCRLGIELEQVRYLDRKGRPKRVRYWAMEPLQEAPFAPNDEVDEVRWLPVDDAIGLLSYERDTGFLRGLDLDLLA